jgi:sugar phosphate isomerase/epimerase
MDVHPRVSVNPQAAGYRGFEDELRLWDALGVRRVGLMSMSLAPYGWDRGLRAARDAGLEVPYVVHGIYTPVTDPERWKADLDSLLACIDAARTIGASCVYFCTGPPGRLTWEGAVELLGERLQPAVAAANAAGVALAIENTLSLRTEISFIHSVRDAVIAARHIGIGICADTYACWIERGLRDTLRANNDIVHLVQISDFKIGTMVQPNRWVPGDGDLPIERIIGDVVDARYTGVFDLELLGPAIDEEGGESAVRRGVAWLNAALTAAGA